jgi:hypothetical protein
MMANKKLPSIEHNIHAATIRALKADMAEKKAMAAALRKLEDRISLNKALLTKAMDGQPTVMCGRAILSVVAGRVDPGALTLVSGGKIPLSEVTGIMTANGLVQPNEVKTWFGGRVIGDSIEIGGEV